MLELTTPDRARIDNLTAELAKYNARMDEDVVVSCTEAARLLHRTPPTISQWIKEGRLHKVARGASVGILLKEIRELNTA